MPGDPCSDACVFGGVDTPPFPLWRRAVQSPRVLSAAITASCAHPPWHLVRTRPFFDATLHDGVESTCPGTGQCVMPVPRVAACLHAQRAPPQASACVMAAAALSASGGSCLMFTLVSYGAGWGG